MFSDSIQMPSITTIISTAASIYASVMVIHSIINKYLSPEFQDQIYSIIGTFVSSLFTQMTLVIEEFEDLQHNQLFKAVDLYLRTIIDRDTHVLKAGVAPKQSEIWVSMEKNEQTIDTFKGVGYKWKLVSKIIKSGNIQDPFQPTARNAELRCFKLRFHKKHKKSVYDDYLPHVLNNLKEEEEGKKTLKLFTLRNDPVPNPWVFVKFDHPATLKKLAMDTKIKDTIIEDLERFLNRKKFYEKVGKSWKRGYLLFGPPGTGKSSLVAAIANYLKFDIYDLDLADVRSNSQLRRLLTSTANRSILLVEDIDSSIQLKDGRKVVRATDPNGLEEGKKVTLSGLLNFIDGLWSSCGDERIIVFTANHKDQLDEALLRPGRMDVHIPMSYCTPDSFKILAYNYLGIKQHPLFSEVEQLIKMTTVTPAEVCELLLKDEEPGISLSGLIAFLQNKKKESDEIKATEIALEP